MIYTTHINLHVKYVKKRVEYYTHTHTFIGGTIFVHTA